MRRQRRRSRVCTHEGCKEPGEQYERWGYGFAFCSTHMEHARKVFTGEIKPRRDICINGHLKAGENMYRGLGCRACKNAVQWGQRHRIKDPHLIQKKADELYLKIIGATV